jgi:branched-subunit amino acid ABC-type transport system permease component
LPEILSTAGIGAVLAFGLLAAALPLSTAALACLRPARSEAGRPLALLVLLPAWLIAEGLADWALPDIWQVILLDIAAVALIGILVVAQRSRAGTMARAAMQRPEAAWAIGLPMREVGRGALLLALATAILGGAVGTLTADMEPAPAWCLAAAPLLGQAQGRPLWLAVALGCGGAVLGVTLGPLAAEPLRQLATPAVVALLAFVAMGMPRPALARHA